MNSEAQKAYEAGKEEEREKILELLRDMPNTGLARAGGPNSVVFREGQRDGWRLAIIYIKTRLQ